MVLIFKLEISVRHTRSSTSGLGIVAKIPWMLLKPAYGIVEPGRIWQPISEDWLSSNGFFLVLGLLQLFVRYSSTGTIEVLVANVVDDFILSGSIPHIKEFHESISHRFVFGSFLMNKDLVFTLLHIHHEEDSSLTLEML